MVQALINLLSNALKFSSSGNIVWLTAEIQPHPTENSPSTPASHHCPPIPHLIFKIQDQGQGIPVDKLETIFERFHQVDASDSRKKGGTGLGLAICRKIVEQHGGQIWVESLLGEGSTFFVRLPLNPEG
jgi:signal transduction histidine kinase